MEEYERYMRVALGKASEARDEGDWAIGAAIVLNGKVILTSRNRVYSKRNRLRHAEMDILEQLQVDYFDDESRMNMIIFTTFEPCPMCFGAIMLSGIRTVVAGANLDESGASSYINNIPKFFKRPHFSTELTCGVLAEECAEMWLSGEPAKKLIISGLRIPDFKSSIRKEIKTYRTPIEKD